MNNTVRPLNEIAREIKQDWGTKLSPYAKPYLDAMACCETINSRYGVEDGLTQVLYFLSNASSWRGETAKRVKAELKKMVGLK